MSVCACGACVQSSGRRGLPRHHHRSDEPTVRAKPTDLSPPLEHHSSPPFPLGMSGDHGAAQRVCDVCLRKWSPASPPPVIGEEQWTPDTRQCESCGKPFTWRRRRHHCRFCGLCVCDACSTGRIKAPGFSTARPAAATGAAYMVQEGLRAPARVGEQPTPPTVGQELTINRTQKKQAVVCGSVHNDEDESQPVARAAALPRRHLERKTNQPGGQTVGGDVTRWNEMAVCKIVISMDDGDDEPEYGTGVL